MPKDVINQYFLNYKESQTLIPIFKQLLTKSKNAQTRNSIRCILDELSNVGAHVDYSPLRGHQLVFAAGPYKVFLEIVKEHLAELCVKA